MEELLTGLGGGSVGIGVIVWYAKVQFTKFEKKIGSMKSEIIEATKDNHIQEEQIKTMQKEIDYMRRKFDK
jgi:trans-2-enoyl-CoA reductase